MKYEYTCLNRENGKYTTFQSYDYYVKGSVLKGKYQVNQCRVIKGNIYLFVY